MDSDASSNDNARTGPVRMIVAQVSTSLPTFRPQSTAPHR